MCQRADVENPWFFFVVMRLGRPKYDCNSSFASSIRPLGVENGASPPALGAQFMPRLQRLCASAIILSSGSGCARGVLKGSGCNREGGFWPAAFGVKIGASPTALGAQIGASPRALGAGAGPYSRGLGLCTKGPIAVANFSRQCPAAFGVKIGVSPTALGAQMGCLPPGFGCGCRRLLKGFGIAYKCVKKPGRSRNPLEAPWPA